MEFSFKLFDFLQDVENKPEIMVMWAAFGIPVLMFALALPLYILRKLGLEESIKPAVSVVYLSLSITWILGFVTMMVLLFANVTGIRMFLVWSLMFLTYLIFCIFNRKQLMKGVDHITKKSKMSKV
jgi:hypothetical protein